MIKKGKPSIIVPFQIPSQFTDAMLEEFDRAAAASIFAQNPKLVQMIQGKLGSWTRGLSTTCTDMDKDREWVVYFCR